MVLEEGNTSIQEEAEDVDEQPLVRHHSRRFSSENSEPANAVSSPPASPHGGDHGSQPTENAFPSDEVLSIIFYTSLLYLNGW